MVVELQSGGSDRRHSIKLKKIARVMSAFEKIVCAIIIIKKTTQQFIDYHDYF